MLEIGVGVYACIGLGLCILVMSSEDFGKDEMKLETAGDKFWAVMVLMSLCLFWPSYVLATLALWMLWRK